MLIADKIPENDENWYSFLLLIKIYQICLSLLHSRDTIPYLRVLIEEQVIQVKKLVGLPPPALKLLGRLS